MKRLARRAFAGGILAVAAAAAAADVVHLTNGRKLEGVLAESGVDRVRIRLEFGEIEVPANMVARVERSDSALREYQERRAALLAGQAGAAEWTALARWARDAGLDHAAAEAALRAIELEPDAAGASGLLGALGYLRDEVTGQWLPYAEAMSRQGYRNVRGTWLSSDEAAALEATEERARREAASAQRDDRLAQAIEMLALAQLADSYQAYPPHAVTWVTPVWGFPVLPGVGGGHFEPGPTPCLRCGIRRDGLPLRNPGSLLPVSGGGHASTVVPPRLPGR